MKPIRLHRVGMSDVALRDYVALKLQSWARMTADCIARCNPSRHERLTDLCIRLATGTIGDCLSVLSASQFTVRCLGAEDVNGLGNDAWALMERIARRALRMELDVFLRGDAP